MAYTFLLIKFCIYNYKCPQQGVYTNDFKKAVLTDQESLLYMVNMSWPILSLDPSNQRTLTPYGQVTDRSVRLLQACYRQKTPANLIIETCNNNMVRKGV